MRTDPQLEPTKRDLKAGSVRREDELGVGRYTERRSWLNRTTDEVASWFGNTAAMRRRQWDEASGDHTGKGPVRDVDADTRIVEDLNQRLTVDSELDASNVRASAHDGVVTLDGSVATLASAQRAEGLATAVSGVKQVVNNLTVA
jgi:osmotically-inducible protein OsmY